MLKFTLMALPFFLVSYAAQAAIAPPKKFASNAPVEINSDKLEVFQEKNLAVFTGHVVAIQGDVRLTSEKMTVHYRKPDEKNADAKTADKNMQQNAIEKIEVDGGVFMSTPEETASGSNGTYDVVKHEIHLNDRVVLTRGNNTLTGDKLVYDFETGKSTITGGAVAAGGDNNSRVRALFVPEKKTP